ncbi:MAG: peptidoglycan DD-metalloendopeptidase family protein [Patescibacteria group bacterium]
MEYSQSSLSYYLLQRLLERRTRSSKVLLKALASVFTLIGFSVIAMLTGSILAGDADHIQLKNTSFCLNTPYRQDNGNVFLWTCNGSDPDQDWEWTGDLIKLKNTNYCLNTPYRQDNGNVFLWTCNSSDPDQQWVRDGELIKLKNTNYCLNTPYRYDNGNVSLWTCNSGDPDQQWVLGSDPSGACPGYGWYCGGSVGENPDYLYYCSGAGAVPALDEACTNGCQTNPPGTPDECVSSSCPGYGWWCGGSVGEDPNNLYYCSSTGASPQLDQVCANGCQTMPPGTPDQCSGVGGCPGYGWWCGDSVGLNPDYLYYCDSSGADPQLIEACANGCQTMPPGTPDQCANGYCPGYGWWCGDSVGGNPNYLYFCTSAGATPQIEEMCNDGCQTMPPGIPDQCSGVGSCPGYGWWCGDSIGGNSDTLYFCSAAGADPQVQEVCTDGCRTNPPGTPDQCSSGASGTCPSYGWWCGDSVGLDPNYLYFCNDSISAPQLSEVCTNGCQTNPPGIPDSCVPAGSGLCSQIEASTWGGPGNYCFEDTLVTCSKNRETVFQNYCGANKCLVNSPGIPDECIVDTHTQPLNGEVLDAGGVSHIYWPFADSSWNNRNGWQRVYGSAWHIHSEVNAQDWTKGAGLDDDCGEELYAPIAGTVIYSGSGTHAGSHIAIRSDNDSEFVVLLGHMQADTLIAYGSHVEAGVTLVGHVGKTGTDNCHLHLSLYKNVTSQLCDGVTALSRIINGQSACWSETTHAAEFELDATGNSQETSFVFPMKSWENYKIEKDFGFGDGPVNVWKDCQGNETANGGNKYHAAIDIIGTNALGTNETDPSIPENIQRCESGSLGAEVVAAGNGDIVSAGLVNNSEGYMITIRHDLMCAGQNVYSTYLHVKNLEVSTGDHVVRGEQIAIVGNYSNNPHLHFEMKTFQGWAGGYSPTGDPTVLGYIDPCGFISSHGGSVPPSCKNVTVGGGIVSNMYDSVSVNFPSNSYTDDLLITMFSDLESPEVDPSAQLASETYSIVAQDENGDLVGSFDQNVTLKFEYDDEGVRHANVSTLAINYFDANSSSWILLPSVIDPIYQKVTAVSDHFTDFGIIGDYINNAPEITSSANVHVYSNELYEYEVVAEDVNQDTLTYELTEAPFGMTIDQDLGIINWATTEDDVGSYNISVRVSDGELVDLQEYTLVVESRPTAVTIVSFKARAVGKKRVVQGPFYYDVVLKWETATEIDNLGFNLYRSTIVDGEYKKINNSLIPSNVPPGSPVGSSYRYKDVYNYVSDKKYFYKLESIDVYGNGEFTGPIEILIPKLKLSRYDIFGKV